MESCHTDEEKILNRTVFVSNINFKATPKQIFNLFNRKERKVQYVNAVKKHTTQAFRGFAYVTFRTLRGAQETLKLPEAKRGFMGLLLNIDPVAKGRKFCCQLERWTKPCIEEINRAGLTTHMNDLPTEVFMLILDYFDYKERIALETVCKTWKMHVRTSLRTVLVLKPGQGLLPKVPSPFRGIDVRSRCSYLPYLDSYSRRTAAVAENSKKPRELFHRCGIVPKPDPCMDGFKKLLSLCGDNLQELDLSGCGELMSERALDFITALCRDLNRVRLERLPASRLSFQHFSKKHNNITSLSLVEMDNMHEDSYWWVFKELTNLKELTLKSCSKLIGRCFYVVSRTLENLEFEDVSRSKIAPERFSQLFSKRALVSVNLALENGSIEGILDRLVTVAPNLRCLSLCNSVPSVSDQTHAVTSTVGHHIAKLKHLVELSLIDSITGNRPFSHHNTFMCDRDIQNIFSCCTLLKKFSLICRPETRITDNGLRDIKNLKQLVNLQLAFDQMTNATLFLIATNCRQLKELSVKSNRISDEGCIDVLTKCTKLQDFSVAQGNGVTVETYLRALSVAEQRTSREPNLHLKIDDCGLRKADIYGLRYEPCSRFNATIVDSNFRQPLHGYYDYNIAMGEYGYY